MIGLPSQMLGNALCLYLNGLNVDVTREIELKDVGAESKVTVSQTLFVCKWYHWRKTLRNAKTSIVCKARETHSSACRKRKVDTVPQLGKQRLDENVNFTRCACSECFRCAETGCGVRKELSHLGNKNICCQAKKKKTKKQTCMFKRSGLLVPNVLPDTFRYVSARL